MSDPLKDYLVNGMSHIRSAFYTTDGTWRQWEAYDCDDIDSLHNDYQRHIPLFPGNGETEASGARNEPAGRRLHPLHRASVAVLLLVQ